MLETEDMKATIGFYNHLLGFVVAETFEDENDNTIWASLIHGEVEIMFKTPNKVMDYGRTLLTGNLYMHTNDVDAIWMRVKDKADVVYPVQDFPYGMREFAIKDNNGYVLSFGTAFT